MSAYLDKSQGITFVYSNIYDLYKRAKDAKIDSPFVADRAPAVASEATRVLKVKDGQIKVEEFQPKPLETPAGERTFAVPMGVREAEEKAKKQSMRPVANLQKNLSDLTEAHEKLRFLLQELESLTKKN
jgi:hypothetical protein